MAAQGRFENDVCAISRSSELRIRICLSGDVFCPVGFSGDVTLRFLAKSRFALAPFCFSMSFFVSPDFFLAFSLVLSFLYVCVVNCAVLLCCLVLSPVCFFFRFNLVFSVFGSRAISTFSSGIRRPLERGTGMAGAGGQVKRPNFENASSA